MAKTLGVAKSTVGNIGKTESTGQQHWWVWNVMMSVGFRLQAVTDYKGFASKY